MIKSKLFITTIIFSILSLKVYCQSEIAIVKASANINNSCAIAAYKSVDSCSSFGWNGDIPLIAADWIIFDLGKSYRISQISFSETIIQQPGPTVMDILGSNDNTNFFEVKGAQNISSGDNTLTVNCIYRYIQFTNFNYTYNGQSGNAPVYIGRVTFLGSVSLKTR